MTVPGSGSSRITTRDIAARAGVHYSTVSLALRNSPRLRPELATRIRAVAEELGYSPDPVLSALNVYRKGRQSTRYQSTIAWINNWPVRDEMRRTVSAFDRYFLGASERARQLGYRLDDFWLHEPGMTPASARSILRARGVTGIIIAPQPHAHTSLALDLPDFSVLALGYSLQPARFHVVTNHQYQATQLLVNELRTLGYRRIGLCLKEDWDEKVNNNFLSVFLLALHRMSARQRVPPLITRESDHGEFVRWFGKHRPDAVIVIDRLVKKWIRDLGLRIPEDVGLVHLNADPSDPWWAGVHQNDWLIGATAADFLAGMLQRNERGIPPVPIRTLVESVWHPGESVRPQSGKEG
jgi:LacI family transcriptional regulator